MPCLRQAALAVKFIGIGPADDPPAIAGHLMNLAYPTALHFILARETTLPGVDFGVGHDTMPAFRTEVDHS